MEIAKHIQDIIIRNNVISKNISYTTSNCFKKPMGRPMTIKSNIQIIQQRNHPFEGLYPTAFCSNPFIHITSLCGRSNSN